MSDERPPPLALIAQRCEVPTHMRLAVMLTVAYLSDAEDGDALRLAQ